METPRNVNIRICKKDQKSSNIRTDMYVNVDFATVLNFPCEFKCIFSYYEGFVINESASVADLPPGFLVAPPLLLVPELVAEFGWQRMVLWMDLWVFRKTSSTQK